MNVFVVPAGADAHELYCEVADETIDAGVGAQGWGRRLSARFREMLAAAERSRHRPPTDPPAGWSGRIGRWIMRHVAEAVAEQRLLWQLRRQRHATLIYPDDLSAAGAQAFLRAALARDGDRHRFWMGVDGLLAAITGPLFFFVPGPNLVAYFFVFRFVGHYLAWRGARQGLDGVAWAMRASGPLAELRAALRLDRAERDRRVHDVAARLHLQHLASFVRRTAP
jgi:hypothetical protein